MNRWVLAATTTTMLAALAGCNSDSDNDDAVVEPPCLIRIETFARARG